jgi:hypothetical protein
MGVMFQNIKEMMFLFFAAHQMSQAHLSKQSEMWVYSAHFLNTPGHESQAADRINNPIGACILS